MSDKKITTYGIRYLGSKSKILPLIVKVINELEKEDNKVIDVFTGTTRVAQALKQEGYDVTTSDLSWASEAYSQAFVCNDGEVSHLQECIDELNALQPKADWITNHYCDVAAKVDSTVNIKVWKPKNGMKADAIREHIETMDIEPWEKGYLISCLIFALDKLDNTVGLQQAYLKGWKSDRVDNDLVLKLFPSHDRDIIVY